MANRNVTPNFTLEQWRVEFNELSDDLGDFNSGITGSIPASLPTYITAQTAIEGLVSDINKIMDGTYQFTGDMSFDSNVSIAGNLTIGGDITIGDESTDRITIAAPFESHLIPENDLLYDLGSTQHGWRNLYVSDTAYLENAKVTALTDGRIVLAGTDGVLEDHSNLTFDGSSLSVPNIDISTEATLASAVVEDLTPTRIVLAGVGGALEDNADLTFDGTTLTLAGNFDLNGDLDVSGDTTLQNELTVAGNVYLTSTTPSDSSTSGALVISGGVGVSEDLFVGGNITAGGPITQLGGDPYTTEGFSIAVAIALG